MQSDAHVTEIHLDEEDKGEGTPFPNAAAKPPRLTANERKQSDVHVTQMELDEERGPISLFFCILCIFDVIFCILLHLFLGWFLPALQR
jgi:hypothetical protein